MGFLTGAFLKIYSAKQRIQLQHRLTSVSMRLLKVQRQSGDMQKNLTRMKQMETSSLTAMTNANMNGQMSLLQQQYNMNSIWAKMQGKQGLTADEQSAVSMYNQAMTQAQNSASIFASVQKNQIEMAFQQMEEMQLEPLKNMEEMLTIEKANIESQLKLIEGQEKAAADMEKASAKDFTPEYTGGG